VGLTYLPTTIKPLLIAVIRDGAALAMFYSKLAI